MVLLGAGVTAFLILNIIFSGDRYGAFLWALVVTAGAGLVTAWRILTSSTLKDLVYIGAREFDMQDEYQASIVNMVYKLAEKAGLQKMPRVAWISNENINAFAYGRPGDGAVVFFSGVLNEISHEELESVTAHEITHLVSGDSISKQAMFAAIQGITYVLLAPLYIFSFICSLFLGALGTEIMGWLNNIASYIIGKIFGFLGYVVMMWFSRVREYAADKGGANLTSPEQMATSLTALEKVINLQTQQSLDPLMSALCIISPMSILGEILSTHPSIEKRISALKK